MRTIAASEAEVGNMVKINFSGFAYTFVLKEVIKPNEDRLIEDGLVFKSGQYNVSNIRPDLHIALLSNEKRTFLFCRDSVRKLGKKVSEESALLDVKLNLEVVDHTNGFSLIDFIYKGKTYKASAHTKDDGIQTLTVFSLNI